MRRLPTRNCLVTACLVAGIIVASSSCDRADEVKASATKLDTASIKFFPDKIERLPSPPRPEAAPPVAIPKLSEVVLRIESRRDGEKPISLIHHRSKAAVSVRAPRHRSEWFFERNPVHDDRIEAIRVDVPHRALLVYSESELAIEALPDRWVVVASFGIDPRVVASLEPTDDYEEKFGRRFRRLVSQDPDSAVRELWWNADEHLPLRVLRAQSGRQTVEELVMLREAAASEAPIDPRQRYASFRVLDICDWREEACGCGQVHPTAQATLRGR